MRLLAALLCASVALPAAAANNLQKPRRNLRRFEPRPAQPPHLVYYGGPVLSSVKLIAVWWGSAVDARVQKDMPAFYADLVRSRMFAWLPEYDTTVRSVSGQPGTNQHIGFGTFVKAVAIAPKVKANPLSDAQVQGELAAQIAAGKLPKPDANTLFMVHFPSGQQIRSGGLSCRDFCAYHNSTRQNVYYGVMPDQGAGSGCDVGCGNAGPIGNLTATASHEVIEAVTDPQVGAVGNAAKFPLAWYDAHKDARGSEYAEIGDICAEYIADLKGPSGRVWKVQKMWSNRANACIVERSDAPVTASEGRSSASGAAPRVH